LHVIGRILTTGPSNGAYILAKDTDTGGADLYINPAFAAAGTPAIQVGTNHPLLFVTNNAERMRIDSSGNVRIGTPYVSGTASLTVNRLLANNDWDAITLGNNGGWSSALGKAALVNVTDGAGTVGKFGVTYDGAGLGAFVVRNLYNGGYGASGDVLYVRGNGNVGIGTSNPAAKLDVSTVTGNTTFNVTNTNGFFQIQKSAGSIYFNLIDTGDMVWRNGAGSVTRMVLDASGYLINAQAYATTTSGAANMHVLSTGVFIRSVSSIKYKTEVEDAWLDYAKKLYDLRPVYYKSLGEFDNPDWSYWGFIAEEVAEVDPRLAHFKTTETSWGENGERVETQLAEPEVEGVQYDRMVPLLLMLMKEQKEQIETLQAEVAALKG
jgi:hypothetical protein